MPAWKVSDEQTASELLSRIGQNTSVYIDSSSHPLDGSDAVILAPTAYKGVTMLITARRRNPTPTYDSTAVLDSPHTISEETIAPEPIHVRLPDETASLDGANFVEDRPAELEPTSATDASSTESFSPLYEEPATSSELTSASVIEDTTQEDFFGPTTWERIENAEVELAPLLSQQSSRSERDQNVAPAPDLTGIPSLPEPVTDFPHVNSKAAEGLPPSPVSMPSKPTPERQYIATGFLGLDETVEDEEDREREKRPWWKKLFID